MVISTPSLRRLADEILATEVTSTRPLQQINIHVLCCFITLAISFPAPPSLTRLSLSRSQGNVTFSCAEPVSVAMTFPGPQSFLQLPWAAAASSSSVGVSVRFQFRTWNKAGLLLTFALPQEGGVVWLYLSEARLRLQIHKSERALLELSAGQSFNASPSDLLLTTNSL